MEYFVASASATHAASPAAASTRCPVSDARVNHNAQPTAANINRLAAASVVTFCQRGQPAVWRAPANTRNHAADGVLAGRMSATFACSYLSVRRDCLRAQSRCERSAWVWALGLRSPRCSRTERGSRRCMASRGILLGPVAGLELVDTPDPRVDELWQVFEAPRAALQRQIRRPPPAELLAAAERHTAQGSDDSAPAAGRGGGARAKLTFTHGTRRRFGQRQAQRLLLSRCLTECEVPATVTAQRLLGCARIFACKPCGSDATRR